jgi:hypothetical protein
MSTADAASATFEISVVPIEAETPWRKGLECVAIALYRQEHACSPTVSWGRMPSGYRMSSGNNAKLVAAGTRQRGGPSDQDNASHIPGIAPIDGLVGDTQSLDWCGHNWSTWMPVRDALVATPANANGLYRIRLTNTPGLLYVGQGLVLSRLAAHIQKTHDPSHRQAAIFAGPIECSWVVNDLWYPHQRLELENDLIAAHALTTGTIPLGQFTG